MTQEGWTTITLGDIAENISVRVDDPSKSGFNRFVGLDHLDSGNFTVSRWGSTESVTSSMKQFQAGDVLLARRNAHLRRASAVDFEGVCSGDAYVLREKPGVIVPGLLKYLLNTNRFWEFAIANADGSMSTRVKWRVLEQFNLQIPSKNFQNHTIKTLDALSLCNRKYTDALDSLQMLHNLGFGFYFADPVENPMGWNTMRADEAFIVRGRVGWKGYKREDLRESGNLVIGGKNVVNDRELDLSSCTYLSQEKYEESPEIMLKGRDMLLVQRGNIGDVGLTPRGMTNATINPSIILMRPEKIIPEFALQLFRNKKFRRNMMRYASGSAQPMFAQRDIKQLSVIIPPEKMQIQYADYSNDIYEKINIVENAIKRNSNLMKVLLEMI